MNTRNGNKFEYKNVNLSRSCFVTERMQNINIKIVMNFIYFPIQIKYRRAATTAELSKEGQLIYWSVLYLSIHVEKALIFKYHPTVVKYHPTVVSPV